jgi:hypothetical protein
MKVRIDRTRMAMSGNNYAYDARVLRAECPQVDQYSTTTYCLSSDINGEYYSFADATRPAEQWKMSPGWERYRLHEAHEKAAHEVLLTLARTVYPELHSVHRWPTLWVEIPELDASHDTRWIDLPEVSQ